MNVEELDSPFSPRSTNPPLFVGRQEEILEFNHAIRSIKQGRRDAVVIRGIRGVGKSTFSTHMSNILEGKHKVETLSVDLRSLGVDDFSDLFPVLVQQKLASKIAEKESTWEKFKGIFGSIGEFEVSGLGIIGAKVSLSEKQQEKLSDMLLMEGTIIQYTKKLVDSGKSGFALILDSINGLSKNEIFPSYLKSMLETFDKVEGGMPFLLILNILPENWEVMINNQESLARDCIPINLKQFDKSTVSNFYSESFRKAKLEVHENALYTLSLCSSGLPMFMQEIGDATFWIAKNYEEEVDKEIAIEGIFKAMNRIGDQFFVLQLKKIQSLKYLDILKSKEFTKLGPKFTTKEVKDIAEKLGLKGSVVNNFLIRMKDGNIIKGTGERGRYEFASTLLYIYLHQYYIPLALNREAEYDIDSAVKDIRLFL